MRSYLGAAREMIHKRDVSSRFKSLSEQGKLELTVESVVLESEWKWLFSEHERKIAKTRLAECKNTAGEQ